jgi:hypothetical protein
LFRSSGFIRTASTQEESGGQSDRTAAKWNLLKPRLVRGGEDCDALSEYSAKSRKRRDFA